MLSNTPIFADVAFRLRSGHVSAGEMASMASGLESATTAIISSPRLPSTRPLSHRWDRSRGLVLERASRRIRTDRTWKQGNGMYALPASKRSYATRELGRPSGSQRTTATGATSYVDNPHRVPGFTGASPQQIEQLARKVKKLEGEASQRQYEFDKLKDSIKSKDVILEQREFVLQDSLQQLDQARRAHKKELEKLLAAHWKESEKLRVAHQKESEQLRAAYQKESEQLRAAYQKESEQRQTEHQKEVETLQQSLRQEQEAGRLELQTAIEKHAQELQEMRDSAQAEQDRVLQLSASGLDENAPILQVVRSEVEDEARQRFDKQLYEIEHRHKLALSHEKAVRAELEKWKDRAEKDNQLRAGRESTVLTHLKDQVAALRREKNAAVVDSNTERLRNERLRKTVAESQKLIEGRKARTEESRRDYFGYRELFHSMGDQIYETLGGATSIEEDLEREALLWRKSAQVFQKNRELLLFRQNSTYDTLQRTINEFLEGRAIAAQAAASNFRQRSGKLLEARKSLNLQGHASRMVTNYLHFEAEPTHARAVSVVHYMSLVLPFKQRFEYCHGQITDVAARIQKLQDMSSEVSTELERKLTMLKARRELLGEFLKYAEAFRVREAMAALLNGSAEDRITFVQTRAVHDRFRTLTNVIARNESDPSLEAIGRQLSRARGLITQQENFVRSRLIAQQDLGQLDQTLVEEADSEIRRRLKIHNHEADVALDVIVRQRRSLAKNMRERKMKLRKVATTVGRSSSTVNDLAVTDLAKNMRERKMKLRKVATTVGRSSSTVDDLAVTDLPLATENPGLARANRVVRRRHTRKSRVHIRLALHARPPEKLSALDAENISASAGAGRLNFTPTPPMQSSHFPSPHSLSKSQEQVSRWSTLGNALRTQSDTNSGHVAVLKPSGRKDAAESAESQSVAMTTSVDQSAHKEDAQTSKTLTRQSSTATSTPPAKAHASPLGPQEHAMSHAGIFSRDHLVDSDAVSIPSSLSSYVPSDNDSAEADVAPGSPAAEDASAVTPEPHTILDYQIPQKAYREAVMASTSSNAAFWTHQLYKSSEGKSPIVYYCKNLDTAERQCKLFLKEPVLGFDLEWEMNSTLGKSPIKKCVSLIQLASEDKICLIHVACFAGETAEQLLPPSLKTILEDVRIVKAGVHINNDAQRMRRCFDVDMKGIFELSHMYRLVKTPDAVSFKLVKLAEQVQDTLLLPLKKDDVRVSAWSKSLNAQQCAYAAADAYAGFRLFHQLDNLRKDLRPTPPRPAFFETYQPIILGDGTIIERATTRPKKAVKKSAAVLGDAHESDDEYHDALEELPNTYELGAAALQDGKVDIDEADPESVAALREVMEKTYLRGSPSSVDSQTSIDAGSNTTVNAIPTQAMPRSESKPSKPASHVLVASPETMLADMWIDSLASRNPKVGAASLRAYHLWHHQNHSLDAVAGLCRQPPLALTSVASYIMTAIKEEDMPYDKDRLKEAFVHLPKSVWHVYGKWVKELGLDQ